LKQIPFLIFLILGWIHVSEAHERTAHYLANEGVMVQRGDLKIVFDPLFDNDYGQFERLPDDMRESLLAGKPPYDGLSAAFVSHSHEDHFSPTDMLLFMQQHQALHLFASEQAIDDLKQADGFDENLMKRITAIAVSAEPQQFTFGDLVIDAHTVPHSGWPDRMTDVHNIVYRVTLIDTTVVHLGDADTKDQHFAPQANHWSEKQIHMAFPPYWFLYSDNGKQVLRERLKPGQVVGIHVPKALPDNEADRPEEYRGPDLFTVPGETRLIKIDSSDR
jgi:hypothetical protein